MQFIGMASDGRAPGDKWVRTHLGWKRLREIGTGSLDDHVGAAPDTRPGRTPVSPCVSPSSSLDAQHSSEERDHARQLNLMLSQRCVSAGRSSRESSHYATISDAVNKLNFTEALHDVTCYPFVCQVVMFLFEHNYWALSGSMQCTLLRITELAKEIAIVRLRYTGLAKVLVDIALRTLEEGRRQELAGVSVRTIDSRIKALLKSKRQLQDASHDEGFHQGWTLCELPSDCLRHIISFLRDPSDIASVGQTCSQLHWLTEENNVWKEMAAYHYGKDKMTTEEEADISDSDGVSWKMVFIEEYRLTRGKLRGKSSGAVCLCQSCLFVYWKAYGHPCSALTRSTTSSSDVVLQHTDQVSAVPPSQHLTVQQFLGLFAC